MSRRQRSESRTESDDAYDANSQRRCGQESHSHTGQNTQTARLFMCRGGMLIRRLRILPLVTASRCWQIASRCLPFTNGVEGSTVGQASSTNRISFSELASTSLWIAAYSSSRGASVDGMVADCCSSKLFVVL